LQDRGSLNDRLCEGKAGERKIKYKEKIKASEKTEKTATKREEL